MSIIDLFFRYGVPLFLLIVFCIGRNYWDNWNISVIFVRSGNGQYSGIGSRYWEPDRIHVILILIDNGPISETGSPCQNDGKV
jgi:hypothetical protein